MYVPQILKTKTIISIKKLFSFIKCITKITTLGKQTLFNSKPSY